MTKIIMLTRKDDEDKDKLNWLEEEFKKRDIEILRPDLPETEKFEDWDAVFKDLVPEITPDTILITKGINARFTLTELETRPLVIKGLFTITDKTTKHAILDHNFEKIKKRVMNLFLYTFETNTDFPLEEANQLALNMDIELFILEGAQDNSDYEDILADILSLEN